MLPKSGVYFVPDEKLLAFMSILREKIKFYEKEQDYHLIQKLKSILAKYRDGEEVRLMQNMKIAQLKELA